ncbi:hypothetical protein, partial [Pseudomonas sp. NBRC 111143]|uniref:hypothetical protein n=1 Tax=Pseudomonas sp. NBRC 111143 TaxID=1661058 RepID=UPI001C4664B0
NALFECGDQPGRRWLRDPRFAFGRGKLPVRAIRTDNLSAIRTVDMHFQRTAQVKLILKTVQMWVRASDASVSLPALDLATFLERSSRCSTF